jgi:hypothetical protein
MYCPRPKDSYRQLSHDVINCNNLLQSSTEYSLTTQNFGPLSSSPPTLWCQRLQTRLDNY